MQRHLQSALRLDSGVCGLPHPQKRATGGEDAWFIGNNIVGVADGVGGWARKVREYCNTKLDKAAAYFWWWAFSVMPSVSILE